MVLNVCFSLIVWFGISFMTGGSFTDLTENVTVCLADAPSGSFTANVIFSVPFQSLFGCVTVVSPFFAMLTLRSRLPEIVHLSSLKALSGSLTSSARLNAANDSFSLIVWSLSFLKAGGSFTDLTVKGADSVAFAPSGSVTVKVMRSAPCQSLSGMAIVEMGLSSRCKEGCVLEVVGAPGT